MNNSDYQYQYYNPSAPGDIALRNIDMSLRRIADALEAANKKTEVSSIRFDMTHHPSVEFPAELDNPSSPSPQYIGREGKFTTVGIDVYENDLPNQAGG